MNNSTHWLSLLQQSRAQPLQVVLGRLQRLLQLLQLD